MSELHNYIHNVLEKGEHGPHRHIEFDLPTLNDAIEQHATRIAAHIQDGANQVLDDVKNLKKVKVHNYLGNISFECIVTEPKNLEELKDVMAKAKREKQNVKAVGSFHSWSQVTVTSGYLVKTDSLTGTERTRAPLRDPSKADIYYDVLSGTVWKDSCLALEKDGRALMNLGGYAGLHISGATSTGTHGSGIKIPPLAGMIRGVTLVSAQFGPDGKPIVYRIEPKDGMTDPHRHTGSVLVQNDEKFNAAIVGLGMLGVVYSVTIETVPFYWIKETRQSIPWSAVKPLLEQGSSGDILKYNNAEIWVNAYTKQALISRREKTKIAPPPDDTHKSKSSFATLVDELPAFKVVHKALTLDTIVDDAAWEVGMVLALFLREFSLIIPGIINLALETQDHKEPKTAKYYDIYDIGLSNYFPAISTEISYPISKYIAATDSVLEFFEKLRGTDSLKALCGFLSLRFTAGFSANMSMSYSPNPGTSPGRCYLEIFSLFAFYNNIGVYDDVVGPVEEMSIDKFQGRLHWGQYLTPPFTAARYKQHDPEFFASIQAFKKVVKEYDPDRMMWNEFLERVIWSAE